MTTKVVVRISPNENGLPNGVDGLNKRTISDGHGRIVGLSLQAGLSGEIESGSVDTMTMMNKEILGDQPVDGYVLIVDLDRHQP